MITSASNSLSAYVLLDSGDHGIDNILFIPGHELIVAAFRHAREIRVFARTTAGEPKLEFKEHQKKIAGIAHLFDDVIVSLDENGKLITWHASSGKVLSQVNTGAVECNSLAKAQDSMLIIHTGRGIVHIVAHDKGRQIRPLSEEELDPYQGNIAVHENILVTFSYSSSPTVWDSTTLKQLGELEIDANVCSVTLNDEMIVVGGADQKLHIFANKPNYPHMYSIKTRDYFTPSALEFIGRDVLMCTCKQYGILFASITKKALLSIPAIAGGKQLEASCIISYSSICVSDDDGYCAIIKMPPQAAKLFQMHEGKTLAGPSSRSKKSKLHTASEKMNGLSINENEEEDIAEEDQLATKIDQSRVSEILDAKNNLNALAKSGLSKEVKKKVAEEARKVWKGWQVSVDDIEFVRKSEGDKKLIAKGGFASVYLGRMKLRDINNDIIPGRHEDVAVKVFTVPQSSSAEKLLDFMSEMFLQRSAQHECILRTMGGYWPDPEEADDDDDDIIEPWIVMERMSCNLQNVLEKGLLRTYQAKLRILRDVAAGLGYLHGRRIVHRDIKPENVLLRMVDGKITGRAKLCDLGVSRTAEQTVTVTMDAATSPIGTWFFMPPESFAPSAQKGSRLSRDIWSLGVLICVVCLPQFQRNIVRKHSESLHGIAATGQLAKEVAESAGASSWDSNLRDVAVSCLSLNPKSRPRIGEVIDELGRRDNES